MESSEVLLAEWSPPFTTLTTFASRRGATAKATTDWFDNDSFNIMLCALTRLVHARWTLAVLYLSNLWRQLLRFTSAAGIKTREMGDLKLDAQAINGPETGPLDPDSREFPAATDDQYNIARRTFIKSLDLDAVCALASRYNNGRPCQVVNRKNGSFNVCFFVEFDQDGPKWIVRVPIEPALDNPWDKLLSEVATMQYLEHNTRIPVPHVRAYGRNANLTTTSTGTHKFLIADLIPGEPLDKTVLINAPEEHRKAFYSQLIDILTELRKLEFPLIGSLLPGPNGSPHPILGPVISMSAATLRLHPQPTFTSAKDYMRQQSSLVSGFYSPPVPDHTVDDIKQEVFALHGMQRIFHQVIDPQLDEGPFVLNHLDLRGANIIVDKPLQIQGIIDWEFASAIPRQVFTPPSWITGHNSIETSKQMHAEFRDVLDEKTKTNSLCGQLGREWYGQLDASKSDINQTDMAFCVAHVLRRPTDVTDIFCDFFAPKLSNKHLDDMMAEFFNEHQTLALEVQRRAEHCERYTQYLKKHGLYETEVDKLLAASKALKEKWDWK
ncbi:phosphotransferase enzyme family protein [Hirsutella rhossiliensis]|uniref:Phosphotransferase enzyme family domain-containing protein n=1 Tax=Hirsutella rhossiliensis TaxID=111463 RepID=A0A9P8MR30_9HYPO|nr:phosphotransferase enzyme family domain-containing protein [Hirsutella rhossiliensis]KAH0959527.1 phosphotransferase enzyme family domain-containing protein [Hirsutella rhossiliensis]